MLSRLVNHSRYVVWETVFSSVGTAPKIPVQAVFAKSMILSCLDPCDSTATLSSSCRRTLRYTFLSSI